MKKRLTPLRPCDPTTIRSAFSESAAATMAFTRLAFPDEKRGVSAGGPWRAGRWPGPWTSGESRESATTASGEASEGREEADRTLTTRRRAWTWARGRSLPRSRAPTPAIRRSPAVWFRGGTMSPSVRPMRWVLPVFVLGKGGRGPLEGQGTSGPFQRVQGPRSPTHCGERPPG